MALTSSPRTAAADEPYDQEQDPAGRGENERLFEDPRAAGAGFALAVLVMLGLVAAAVLAAGDRIGWAYTAAAAAACTLWQLWRMGPGR